MTNRITLYLDDSLDVSGCTNFRIHTREIVEGHESEYVTPGWQAFLNLCADRSLISFASKEIGDVCTKNC